MISNFNPYPGFLAMSSFLFQSKMAMSMISNFNPLDFVFEPCYKMAIS